MLTYASAYVNICKCMQPANVLSPDKKNVLILNPKLVLRYADILCDSRLKIVLNANLDDASP